ncbi:MAG: CRTAC1 family protein [Alphaproteobacteria bacterium]|nr:CRTAC1 family protein [Alphaproteobacteria bacterium]
MTRRRTMGAPGALLLLLGACSGRPGAPDQVEETGEDSALGPVEPWCAAPAEAVTYVDQAEAWGLVDTADGDGRRKEAGAVAALDLDGDGLDELIVAHRALGLVLHSRAGQDGPWSTQLLLATPELSGLALGDIDGDGDLDLWAGGYAERMVLLRNEGPGDSERTWRFEDVSESAGLAALATRPQKMDAVFGDFDGDEDLDLYIVHAAGLGVTEERSLDKLLRNDGAGHFEEVSAWLSAEQRQGVSWAPAWVDLDGDGDLELFVANADQGTSGPSLLLENAGPGSGEAWSFVDRSDTCGCTNNFNPMGVSPGDYDNDGDLDLFLTNTASNQLLRNEGALVFTDVSRAVGAMELAGEKHMTFGSVWVDIDNDGWQDLFVASGPLADLPEEALDAQADQLLYNLGGAFEDRAPALGLDQRGVGRGVTRAMFNDDGFPELVVVNLDGPSHVWQPSCTEARALVVSLSQSGGNTRGIGARVTLRFADGGVAVQEISAKAGWGGAMEPRAWFGLADRPVERLSVRWPDGLEQEVSLRPDVDGRIELTR